MNGWLTGDRGVAGDGEGDLARLETVELAPGKKVAEVSSSNERVALELGSGTVAVISESVATLEGVRGCGEVNIRSVRLLSVDTGTEKVDGPKTSAMMEEAASVDWLLAAAAKERSGKI